LFALTTPRKPLLPKIEKNELLELKRWRKKEGDDGF